MAKERKKCCVEGCDLLVAIKSHHNGVPYYRKTCEKHRNHHRPNHESIIETCSICGWVGHCDKHRIKLGKDGGRYTKDNVLVLCPNCHRHYHGLGEENQLQVYPKEKIPSKQMELF
jgi:hypothetical protein